MKALVGLFFVLAACETPPQEKPTFPSEQPNSIPVPADFTHIEAESFTSTIGSFRKSHHVWRGHGDVSEVTAFFEKRLPQEGWEVDSNSTDDGRSEGQRRELHYRNNLAKLVIVISQVTAREPTDPTVKIVAEESPLEVDRD